jgi:hypothetical protein
MDTTDYIILLAVISLAWALGVRRHTWRNLEERTATLALLLNLVAVLMAAPLGTKTVGRWGFWLLGQHNLNSWLAHCLCLGGTTSFTLHMLMRVKPAHTLQREFHHKMGLPLTFAVPVMLACLWESRAAEQAPRHDFADIAPDVWLVAYWFVFCVVMLYLECLLALLLLDVRVDDRSHRLADIYLVGVLFAVMGLISRVVTILYDDTDNARYLWTFACTAMIVFSSGCAYSWHKKTDAWLYRQLSPQRRRQLKWQALQAQWNVYGDLRAGDWDDVPPMSAP